MPTGGSTGIHEPLPVDINNSTPIGVSVQEPVAVADGGGSLTVDGIVDIGNFPSDRELKVLCDAGAANTAFLRRYNVTPAGVITFTDTLLDGTTPYVPVGPVVVCTSSGSAPGNPVAVTFSLVSAGGSLTTSALARRVQAVFMPQPAPVGIRDSINGVPLNRITNNLRLEWGDLGVPGYVPPLTFASPNNSNRQIWISQEF